MATQVVSSRLLRDNSLTTTKALPSTSSNNTTDPIDLGSGPFNPEEIEVEIYIPAMTTHVTVANNLVISLYTSATTTLGATSVLLMSWTQPGVASTGTAAATYRFKLPPGTSRYIGFHQVCGATDDLSGTSITYSILV